MIPIYAFAASAIVGLAIYMILSRNLVRILLGLSLLSTGINLVLFIGGGMASREPPIIREGETRLGEAADPLNQALILTAIVIGFALTLILATIVLRAWRSRRELDSGIVDTGGADDGERPMEPTRD